MMSDALDVISMGRPLSVEAGRRAGRMAASIDYDWPNHDPEDEGTTRAMLQGIRQSCRLLHDDIQVTYFEYEIEDIPRS